MEHFIQKQQNTHSSQQHMENSPVRLHVSSQNKSQKVQGIEIISRIFSNQNGVKLEINQQKKIRKHTNMWRRCYWTTKGVNKEIEGEIKTCLEINENRNTTYQIICNSSNAVLRGKLLAMQAYLKKQTNKIPNNNLILYLKELEKEQIKLRTGRKLVEKLVELVKIRVEITRIETKK